MLSQASFFAILSGIWIERNNIIFKGVERWSEEV